MRSFICLLFLKLGYVNLNEIPETSSDNNIFNDYNNFPDTLRLEMKQKVKDMFYFGYDNYMKHAFPLDELNPIYCKGRGPDKKNP